MAVRIIIETTERIDGFLAEVVDGPDWAKRSGISSGHRTAKEAFDCAAGYIQSDRRREKFEFIHAAL